MDNLVERSKEGDADAFTKMIENNMQAMYKVAKSILKSDEDVADVIQESILNCWKKIGSLKENRYFKTWMTRILINECYDLLKKKQEYLTDENLIEIPSIDTGFENIEWSEMLNYLDEKYRLVIMLYYVEGFKTSEISQILEISESAVRTRLARGRKKISVIYKKEERSAL